MRNHETCIDRLYGTESLQLLIDDLLSEDLRQWKFDALVEYQIHIILRFLHAPMLVDRTRLIANGRRRYVVGKAILQFSR